MSLSQTLVSWISTTKRITTSGHVLDMLVDAPTETVVLADMCLRSGLLIGKLAAKPRVRHQTPNRRASRRGTAFGHSQSRDPTVPSAARNTPQHSYLDDSSLLSSIPQRFIIRLSTIIHICDRVRHSYTRLTAYQQPFDCLLRAITSRRISSRVASTHLTNILHSPSKHLDDSIPLYTSNYPYRIT